jgi:hypothetical protein
MLNFSSTYFNDGTGVGQPIVAAGGGIWDTLIYDLWNTGGDLDVAVGVNLDLAGGTQADATTAKITLTPTGTEGVTTMIFRSDASEDPGLVASTYLSDVAGEPVWPTKVNSVNIYIDGTKPLIDITDDLGSNPVLQGTYTITVTASDENSGLVGAPVVKLDGNVLSASGSGPWTYTVVVNSSTTNGAHAITADISDNAGNAADQDVRNFTVNKNEINGTVTMPGYVGGTRAVAFSIDGATPVSQNLTFNSSGVASYKLVNVATPTTLSAKTAWTLRDKNTLSFDGDGQAVSNFTLLGGDINATNSVNVLDYSVLKLRWLSYNAAADVNGDGVVTSLDIDIMKANWFKTGDTQ